MRILFPLAILLFSLGAFSQNYPLSAIDKMLLKNANAVVRLNETVVTIRAYDNVTAKQTRVVTVLNEAGQRYIKAFAFYDKEQKITALEAQILDAYGTVIDKFKQRDFLDHSASGDGTLYSDNRVKFLRYTPVTYPYTVILQKSYTTSDTAFLPHWNAIEGYNVSIEKSNHLLVSECDVPIRHKEQNLTSYGIAPKTAPKRFFYEVENVVALEKEPYSPSLEEILPRVKFAMEKFHLKGVDGQAKNWMEFGTWINDQLLNGQDILDDYSRNRVQELVQGISDPKEKVRRVYAYLQDNTRYISVQLGIGGWKPISASEVGRVKYGDCKGLTNYAKAMLKEVGVDAYYTVVQAGKDKRNLDPDFPSLSGNHVFLNVPLENEELWLECTSQEVPMNFLGTFSDDRYVLKVTPKGGELVKSRKYTAEESKQFTEAFLKINDQATVNAEVTISSTGIQYDQKYTLATMKVDEVEEYYKEYWDYINNLTLSSTSIENDKDNIELVEEVAVSSENYISQAGDQWLFAPNMFNRNRYVPKKVRSRKNEVVIKRGYYDEDRFVIQLPSNMTVEQLLPEVNLKTDFGEYSLEMQKISEHELLYQRKLLIHPGSYPKERYGEFRDFRKQVARSDNSKIVLIKT
ncbi:MAG: DUF3857 and transglutaminase domain-containing protein [Bacteroidota bacterium]